jgi:hypothetical protein
VNSRFQKFTILADKPGRVLAEYFVQNVAKIVWIFQLLANALVRKIARR